VLGQPVSATLSAVGSFLFYASAAGVTAGIFVGSLFSFDAYLSLCIGATAAGVLLIAMRKKDAAVLALLLVGVFGLFFCVGALRMEFATSEEQDPYYEALLETEVVLEGMVAREVERTPRSSRAYIQVGDQLLLAFAPPHESVSYGDRVLVSGTVKAPEAFETDLGRVFDYQNYLRSRGVNYTIAYAQIEVLERNAGDPLRTALYAFKSAFMRNIESAIRQPEAGLGEGLLLGVKQALGEDLETAFRKSGITHIVVLSGYNVMLVVSFITYVLAFLLPLRLRIGVGLAGIAAFALLVGLSATVLRASLMAALLLIAQATGRTYAVLRALMLTGICMLLLNPYLLVYDVGFQLSFIATLGLILFAPYIERYVQFMPAFGGLRSFLTATLATQLFVAPLLLYQIGELSIVSVIVNVLVLPMVPLAMLLTFAAGVAGFFSITISLLLAFFAAWCLWYILFIAQTFAELPFASFVVPAFPFPVAVAAYLLLAALLWRTHRQNKEHTHDLAHWTIIDEADLLKENNR